jgi:hypothetical protein
METHVKVSAKIGILSSLSLLQNNMATWTDALGAVYWWGLLRAFDWATGVLGVCSMTYYAAATIGGRVATQCEPLDGNCQFWKLRYEMISKYDIEMVWFSTP